MRSARPFSHTRVACSGARGRVGIYYGNLTGGAVGIASCDVELTPSSQAALLATVGAPPSSLPPRGQALQMVQLECAAVFADAPVLRLSTDAGGARTEFAVRCAAHRTQTCAAAWLTARLRA